MIPARLLELSEIAISENENKTSKNVFQPASLRYFNYRNTLRAARRALLAERLQWDVLRQWLHAQMHGVRSMVPAADLRIRLQKCRSRSENTHMLVADVGISRAGVRIRLFFDGLRAPKLVFLENGASRRAALRRMPRSSPAHSGDEKHYDSRRKTMMLRFGFGGRLLFV